MDTTDARLVMTAREVAGALQISESHARRLANDGEIPSLHLGGRLLFPRHAIAKWLDERAAASVAKPAETPASTPEAPPAA